MLITWWNLGAFLLSLQGHVSFFFSFQSNQNKQTFLRIIISIKKGLYCYCQPFWKESFSTYCEFLYYWNVAAHNNLLLGSFVFFRILLEGNFWNIFREQFVRGFIWTDFRGINCTQQRLAWRTANVKERRSMSSVQYRHHAAMNCHYFSFLELVGSSSPGFSDRKEKTRTCL